MKKIKFPKQVTLSITKKDIEDGKIGEYNSCAISLSGIRRFLNLLKTDRVFCGTGDDDFRITTYNEIGFPKSKTYKINKKANDFIKKFDYNKNVKPCRLTLKER